MNRPQFRLAMKRWRRPIFKVIFVMLAIEAALTVPALALTGIADPNTYREKLWHDGYMNGFNSDPSTILYAYANYKPVKVPLVWSGFITKFNLVIVVLSMFLLLCESCMIFVHVLYPIISLVLHLVKVGLFAFSIYAQTAPDTIDPQHQNHGAPWYIKHPCSVSYYKSDIGYCQQAKSTFYVMMLMLALFGIHILLATQAMLFAPEVDPDEEAMSPFAGSKIPEEEERQWEMVRIPDTPGTTGGLKSPMTPMTPRTKAFNVLEGGGGLPLREKLGPQVYSGVQKS